MYSWDCTLYMYINKGHGAAVCRYGLQTILHTQTFYQSFKADLKSSGNLIGWNLKNGIIFGKCAFFDRYCT
jgi:hypothetical protein